VKPAVFVHTNDKQMLGALVSAHSMRRNSRTPEAFDVRILNTRDHPFLLGRDGQPYRRNGRTRVWRDHDLQSFTPLRFHAPAAAGYAGRALVVDPDVFAVGDVCELLSRDMQGHALLCRVRPGRGRRPTYFASSVMLLDCARLTHWRCPEDFAELFARTRDYDAWMNLELEDPATIGLFEDGWNAFDVLDADTRLLHNTKRLTQPWKTGLPIDYTPADHARPGALGRWLRRLRATLTGEPEQGRYRRHPDARQERFFFGLLRECLEQGVVTEDFLRQEIQRRHVRSDVFERLEAIPVA
jgi:hypothetical protein